MNKNNRFPAGNNCLDPEGFMFQDAEPLFDQLPLNSVPQVIPVALFSIVN